MDQEWPFSLISLHKQVKGEGWVVEGYQVVMGKLGEGLKGAAWY